MRATPRERRPVSPGTLRALKPLFRYSIGRDAYVLRAIGNRTGPVLVVRREPGASSSPTS